MDDEPQRSYRALTAMSREVLTPRLDVLSCPSCGQEPTGETVDISTYVGERTTRFHFTWTCPHCDAGNVVISEAPRQEDGLVDQVGAAKAVGGYGTGVSLTRHYAVRPEQLDCDPLEADPSEVMDEIEALMEGDTDG